MTHSHKWRFQKLTKDHIFMDCVEKSKKKKKKKKRVVFGWCPHRYLTGSDGELCELRIGYIYGFVSKLIHLSMCEYCESHQIGDAPL
jgi:hypothetical protein